MTASALAVRVTSNRTRITGAKARSHRTTRKAGSAEGVWLCIPHVGVVAGQEGTNGWPAGVVLSPDRLYHLPIVRDWRFPSSGLLNPDGPVGKIQLPDSIDHPSW